MKYIVSWYEKDRMLVTNCCKTFKSLEKAKEFLDIMKQNHELRDFTLSKEMEL